VGGGTMVIVGCDRPFRILRSWVSSAAVRFEGGWGGGGMMVMCGWVWPPCVYWWQDCFT
jgi:hypothetical protein